MSHELTWRRLRRAISKVAAFGRLPMKLIADSPWLIADSTRGPVAIMQSQNPG